MIVPRSVPATIRRETSMLRERASVRWKDFSVALAKKVWLKPFRSHRTVLRVLRVLELCASGGVTTACGFVLISTPRGGRLEGNQRRLASSGSAIRPQVVSAWR